MLGNTPHRATSADQHAGTEETHRPRTGVRRRTLQGVAVGAVSVALAFTGQSAAHADHRWDDRGDGQWQSWSRAEAPAPAPVAPAAAPAPAPAPAAAPAAAVALDLAGAPTATSTAFSAWAPHVRPVVAEVAQTFGVSTVYTRAGHSPTQELAADFMVYDDRATGDAVARFVLDNAARFGVEYVIWQQRIHNVGGSGWQPMEDRGSATANHMDHVHVSFSG